MNSLLYEFSREDTCLEDYGIAHELSSRIIVSQLDSMDNSRETPLYEPDLCFDLENASI